MGCKVTAIEYYLPEKFLTNDALAHEFSDWDPLRIEKKTGVRQRHIAAEGETSLDLAVKAGRKVLKRVGCENIDFLIVCTETPDYYLPPNACLLQERLGLSTNVGAMDINMGCSGYVYGLSVAKGLIVSQAASNILFITTETYSKLIHPQDRVNRTIFGDGAAATLITRDSLDGICSFVFGTDGAKAHNLIVKNGGLRHRYDASAPTQEDETGNVSSDNHLYMNGPEIFKFMISTLPSLFSDLLDRNRVTLEQIDYIVFHQANKFMLEYIRDKLSIPVELFHIDIRDTGNTVSASIPIALKDAWDGGRIRPGSRIILAGFGVGLSWAGTIIHL